MTVLDALFSAGTTYLLYFMGGFPFAVWASMGAYAASLANRAKSRPARPGSVRTFFCVILPVLFIVLYVWNSRGQAGIADPSGTGAEDDWTQVMFLLLPPCFGLIAGYGAGTILANRRGDGHIGGALPAGYGRGDNSREGMTLFLTIAIDGPAASGKGTLGRRIADYYHLAHLDTGLTYRAVAHMLITKGWPLDDAAHAIEAARLVDLGQLDKHALSAHAVADAASKVAVIPEVRRILVDKQRAFAEQPGGAVLDGRDIGTVVCPDAPVKLYVTASAEVRAMRRLRDIEGRGGSAELAEILSDIQRRDERDMGRADSPLKPAADAHLLDTSEMSIEAAFRAARAIIDGVLAKRNEA